MNSITKKIGTLNEMNKTLCILGNSKVGDLYGAKVVSMLKNQFGVHDIRLIGNGGEHMKKQHQMNSIIDLEDLREKMLYLWRYSTKSFYSMKFSPMFYYQHVLMRTNEHLLKSMQENNVYENIVRARPSCIIALDNEHLSREMLLNVFKNYNEHEAVNIEKKHRPDSYVLTNTVRHWEENHKMFCDKAFYTLSLRSINKRWYVYPSHYIGQYGSYDALKHIYIKSGLFSNLVKENSIIASREHSLDHIEKARLKIKDEFRIKHKIDPDSTVVFFAPGNTIKENIYGLEAFRRGYNEFVLRHSSPTSLSHYSPAKNMFKLVISLHQGTESEAYIRKYLKDAQYETDVVIVSNEENEHYDAMCSSDFGVVYNGQMLASAATLHLHCVTMQNMNDLHYFWHTWENRWLADINTNADRPAVQEFAAGEFWYGKICETLSSMHTRTDSRWDQVRALRPFVLETLPYKNIVPNEGDKEITIDQEVFDEYEDPIYIMASNVYESMKNYNNHYCVTPDLAHLSKPVPSLSKGNYIF